MTTTPPPLWADYIPLAGIAERLMVWKEFVDSGVMESPGLDLPGLILSR